MYEYFVRFMMAQCMTAGGTGALFAFSLAASAFKCISDAVLSNSTEIPPQGCHCVARYGISQKLCAYDLALSLI